MKNYLIVIMILCLFCASCKNRDTLNEREVIEKLINQYGLNDDNDVKNNAKIAISEYENQKLDLEPVQIFARFSRPIGRNYHISLLFYHEASDLLGIGINEKYIDSRGIVNTLNEEYPVFIFIRPSKGATPWMIPIKIRDSDQLKPEAEWEEYITGENIDMNRIQFPEYWSETLPNVWVSIPEPNKVEVEMYIYDKEGNKSNSTTVYWKGDN